jgi:hypothetical protein
LAIGALQIAPAPVAVEQISKSTSAAKMSGRLRRIAGGDHARITMARRW